MSRNRRILLIVRILLFVVLGILFVLQGMGMEITTTKALFIGIGIADFAYAFFLAKPFWQQKQTPKE